jgi:hypothetical protein
MMAALALAAGAGTGNAVEVIDSRRSDFPPAAPGGNWQGVPYLSYAEHDRCVRTTFGLESRKSRDFAYHSELEQIIASR